MNHLIRSLLLLTVAWAALPVQAANLDQALLKNAPDLLVALKKANIKVVGVLPFAVQRGTRPAAFDCAPLSAGLPTRLENALILRQPGNEPDESLLKVLRDVVGTAARAGVGAWSKDQAAFQKLFAGSYELAWGNKKLSADAFLTGEVRLLGDGIEAEVVITFFKPDSWKDGKPSQQLASTFKVKTDRSLLRDLGYNAVVNPRALKRKGAEKSDAEELDQEAVARVANEEEGKQPLPDAKQPDSHSPDSLAGFKFEIEYDGVKQAIRSEVGGNGAKHPTYSVDAPKPGQKVSMFVTRTLVGDAKMGIVLRINGKSTWNQEDADPASCRRWIFNPMSVGKREDFAGFYREDKDGKLVCNEWKALDETAAVAAAATMGVRIGWIDLDVFASREEKAAKDGMVLVSTRSMPKTQPSTLRDLRHQLAMVNNITISKVNSRHVSGLLIGDVVPVPAGELKSDSLGNVVYLGGISIRYLSPPKVGKTIEK